MTDVYWCLRDSAHASTVGVDTSDEALIGILESVSYNGENGLMSMTIPFGDPMLMNMQEKQVTLQITMRIMYGTSRPFSTLALAITKFESLEDNLKLNKGTWSGTTWTSATTGWPSFPSGSLAMVISRRSYSFSPQDIVSSFIANFEFMWGSSVI